MTSSKLYSFAQSVGVGDNVNLEFTLDGHRSTMNGEVWADYDGCYYIGPNLIARTPDSFAHSTRPAFELTDVLHHEKWCNNSYCYDSHKTDMHELNEAKYHRSMIKIHRHTVPRTIRNEEFAHNVCEGDMVTVKLKYIDFYSIMSGEVWKYENEFAIGRNIIVTVDNQGYKQPHHTIHEILHHTSKWSTSHAQI